MDPRAVLGAFVGRTPSVACGRTGPYIPGFFGGIDAVVVEVLVRRRFWRGDGSPWTRIVAVCGQRGFEGDGPYDFARRRVYHGVNGPCRAGSEAAVARQSNILTEEKQEDNAEKPGGFRDSYVSQLQDTDGEGWHKANNVCYTSHHRMHLATKETCTYQMGTW